MATAVTKRKKLIVAESVSPLYREVIATYLSGRDVELVTIPLAGGRVDLNRLESEIDDRVAGVLISQPNFFGLLEQADLVSSITHQSGAKLIMTVDPIAAALLKTPGDIGADIVVGEGQPLGLDLNFGGPLLGFFAARKELVRYVPGRLVGRTMDVDGKPGFVLTLQTREQHIRREKATSNICTNQALCATAAAVYMSLLGKQGLKQVALLSAERAQLAHAQLTALEGVEPYFDGPFVREFALRVPMNAQSMILSLVDKGLLPGVAAARWYTGLDDCLIVALTEKRSEAQIDLLVKAMKELTTDAVLSSMQR